ncbi:hypothetical protein CNE_BB2p01840 (plasmid) [Cupriavidus necator N-1]|uniref:Uncharacterized protein n=1 Tax=Cupriavidus necator (strain ATCC 43291 / DSM 13513 / CCUG 52238 / LMG 8453 / N-1) TaxID=1042878 RepID=F8GYQ4_CUPNN|nr:hypothetical protein [Cupriavidus necator]AEI82995.1 hypothetical protein CNE_BB2p01840 [Cupriavidus necator N-1]MDX6008780.1 hypothetical protein [Cupriavidus necator]
MARYLPILARAFGVGAFIVIAAIVSRQVYLRSAAEGLPTPAQTRSLRQ